MSAMPPHLELGSTADVAAVLTTLHRERRLDLPPPARGRTWQRLERLLEFSAMDLSLGRLIEGHADAQAILAEGNREPHERQLYGVWAAEPPGAGVVASPSANGFRLRGTKRYCSGARTLDRALVTARAPSGALLFDVDLRAAGVRPIPGTWPAIGMANSDSLDVEFDLDVTREARIGTEGFYVARVGFWHGAVGVAACWLGGAVGCARMVKQRVAQKTDEHAAAHFGAIVAECNAMRAALERAARDIDEQGSQDRDGERRALIARQIVEQGCQRVLAAAGRATGTGPLVFDAQHARRAADLVVYLRQHHAERDAAALCRRSLGHGDWP